MEGTNLGLLLKKKEEEKRMMNETNLTITMPSNNEMGELTINPVELENKFVKFDKFQELTDFYNDLDKRLNELHDFVSRIDSKTGFVFDWLTNNSSITKLNSIIFTFNDGIQKEISKLQESIDSMNFFQKIIHYRRIKNTNIKIETLQNLLYIYVHHLYNGY